MLGSEKPLLFFLTLFKIKVMSTREEKKQARIERYEAAAAKAERQSQAAYRQSQDMVSGIPMGQPILVGHHSEGRHRRLLDRSWNKLGESVRLEEKAEYYRRKAEAVASNDAIYTEDEDAEERLEQKIAMLTQLQEKMKAANKIAFSKKLTEEQMIAALVQQGYSEEKATTLATGRGAVYGHIGFPSFTLSNNNACIRNAKQRLKHVQTLKNTETKEYTIGEVRVVENTKENRLQLFFSGKPADEIRAQLKHMAFRWSPSNECWQSYLNRWQIDRAKALLNTL